MKIDLDKKIEKCTKQKGKKHIGPISLENIWLDVENKKMVATNGRMLACISVEPSQGDTSGYIPQEVFSEARTYKATEINCNGKIEYKKTGVYGDQVSVYNRPNVEQVGPYPKWEMIVPATDRKEVEICLNPTLLLKIAEALGVDKNNGIKLKIELNNDGHTTLSPIRIEPLKNNGDFGLLMPCKGDK